MRFTRKAVPPGHHHCRFLADPLRALAEISTRTDAGVFRAFTFYGVLLAFPMALYCLLFAGLRLLAGIVAGTGGQTSSAGRLSRHRARHPLLFPLQRQPTPAPRS